MTPTIKLDGREFETSVNGLTAAQDNFILGHLRSARVFDLFVQGDELSVDEKRIELLTRILVSGRASRILAGLLTESGKKWTHAEAERNAARFDDVTEIEEKQRMRDLLASCVLGFLPLGERSSRTSLNSSSQNETGQDTASGDLATSATSLQ